MQRKNSIIARRNNIERVTKETTTQITKKFFYKTEFKKSIFKGRDGAFEHHRA
jgi:hypothetical protein